MERGREDAEDWKAKQHIEPQQSRVPGTDLNRNVMVRLEKIRERRSFDRRKHQGLGDTAKSQIRFTIQALE